MIKHSVYIQQKIYYYYFTCTNKHCYSITLHPSHDPHAAALAAD